MRKPLVGELLHRVLAALAKVEWVMYVADKIRNYQWDRLAAQTTQD